ncbi:MAG: hypothetical protein ACHQD8_03170 [Chitinophagales bacterium]
MRIFFVVISMLLFSACRQAAVNRLTDPDDNGGYASDASRIELYNNDAISIADVAGFNYNRDNIGNENCVSVATDTLSSPHVLIIRFNDCTCLDGRTRKGSILVSYNGQYADSGKVHTITFDHYYINGTQMTGSIKSIRVDTTITGNWYYKISVNDSLNMSLDPLQSQYVVWTGTLVRKWVAGYLTPGRTDDIFSISGSATLTRPNLHVFSFDISTPLQFALNCDYAESGVVNVTGYNGPRILNYGTGYCDADAQLSINTLVYNILLAK